MVPDGASTPPPESGTQAAVHLFSPQDQPQEDSLVPEDGNPLSACCSVPGRAGSVPGEPLVMPEGGDPRALGGGPGSQPAGIPLGSEEAGGDWGWLPPEHAHKRTKVLLSGRAE